MSPDTPPILFFKTYKITPSTLAIWFSGFFMPISNWLNANVTASIYSNSYSNSCNGSNFALELLQ